MSFGKHCQVGLKVNKNILKDEDVQIVMIPSTALAVVSIHVPRADYNNRPVFINGNQRSVC